MKKIIAFVMRRIISLTALILVLAMMSGCGSFKQFNETNIVCQIKIYDNWEDKTCYYEVDNKGNSRECEKFEPNAKKVYYEESTIMMQFSPNLDSKQECSFYYDKQSVNLPDYLVEKLKTAGEKFAYREGYHDTWLTKLFKYNGEYYVEAMLNVNISCPFYLLKLDEKNNEFIEIWSGSEKEILELKILNTKNGQD